MKKFISANRFFFFPFAVFALLGAIVLSVYSKDVLHLAINRYHSSFADVVFPYITYLGDGYTVLLVIVIAAFIKYRYSLFIGLSYLFSSAIAQWMKHYPFDDHVRPAEYFQGKAQLHIVQGVELHIYNSFPSGHTTTAFALFLFFTLLSNHHSLKFLFFILALLIAYSRVYLSQHFFEDIYAGAFIGILSTLFMYYLFYHTKLNQAKWLNGAVWKTKS